MATLKSVQAKIEKLQAQAQAIKEKESATVFARIYALMDDYGISIDDLKAEKSGAKRLSTALSKNNTGKPKGSTALYRDPVSGAEWSGRGRAPRWIANAKSRDKFLIDSNSVSTVVAKKAQKPVGNYPRGPQPAKYRDPATGAEWSGRGMAPRWLAAAKDRTKFLIDAPVEAQSEQRLTASKKAATRPPAAQKAATKLASKKATAKKAANAAKKAANAAKKAPAKQAAVDAATKTVVKKKAGPKSAAKKGAAEKVNAKAPTEKAPVKKVSSKKVSAKTTSSERTPEVVAPVQSGDAGVEHAAS